MISRTAFRDAISQSIAIKQDLLNDDAFLETLELACNTILTAINSGKKLLIAGNGGSAADAQHIAAEFVGRFFVNRKALKAISLTTDTSVITALSNDFGYETVFSRQLEALGEPGDVFLAISTSGTSKNLINALHTARLSNISTISFTGARGSAMEEISDITICVPSKCTPRIQECHILIAHIICETVEREIL